ncbi:hypothetical protein BACT_1178 [Bifidobacterium actinocoloniiforme DSM 22766]|uniref:DUF4125 domain-containing protein n=1 Tax=Bifidobacterium actinocoloniiforme DSM 22766 TaxID=1437605 RepID=A0A086Z1S4_9BIFI|nr:DUF4125 family protein [Bifidobacterium actinocoloniiforme]AKV55583.1 hypothetical protein AB656_04510 [Bifidobacterium actinocoloniiforme DSM 22766]KFI40474.1 hypothetical protein BACT_1178 [Bifidobacterium actinocoloniiforme DSM 22766]
MSERAYSELSDDDLRERIVKHEWDQFQQVDNEGGRANCQGNWPTFHQMRLSQFSVWPRELLESYADDLDRADAEARNLLTEKYGRMMESTAPEDYRRDIAPYLPKLGLERQERQERVIRQQVAWAKDFRDRYPTLGQEMRRLRTADDTAQDTSFETYLRGELSTYSLKTLGLYEKMVLFTASQRRNLTEETLLATVKMAGYPDLDQAEAAQRKATPTA